MMNTSPRYPVKPLNELLIEARAAHGSGLFLRADGREITYGNLVDDVERAASCLKHAGFQGGDRVGLMLEHHYDHLVLFFALAWIGAVHVPVSIHLKKFGLQVLLEDAKLQYIVAETKYAELLLDPIAADQGVRLCLWRGQSQPVGERHVSLEDVLGAESSLVEPIRGDLNRLAMITFTSGTTGRPKGAMETEMHLVTGARQIAVLADINTGDTHLWWEPLYHISGWFTAIMGIQTRTPLVHMSRFSASNFWRLIRSENVNKFHYMGGVINILLAQPEDAEDGENPVTLAWGGAAPKGSWLEFERRFRLDIREAYGLSEAGNIVTMNIDGPVGSCGRAQPEYDMWVEGPDGTHLPPGEIGEFVIKAQDETMLMLGYFNDPERTALTRVGTTIRTGDLGHRDAEGYFYFFGRAKDAIRRRGENVSAWEVERAVALHPDVEDAAAVGIPSEMGEQDIKLFIKPAPGRSVDLDDLALWAEGYLARYQLPRFIEIVEEFPRGPTQRVQKHLLSAETASLTDYDLLRRTAGSASARSV